MSKNIDEVMLLEIAKKLTNLSTSYSTGGIKHYQYVSEYDKILEYYKVSKKDILESINNRK